MRNKTALKQTTPKPTRFVAYYRVSTQRQGLGFGLEAQKRQVHQHLKREPDWEFTEIESGTKSKRPELERALACCRMHDATLVVAKLDRLARNTSFTLALRDSGLPFVALDCPYANKLTITILAAVAEQERDWISERTKAGLAVAKSKGVKLGNPRPAKSIKKAHAARLKNRQAFVEKMRPVIAKAQKAGLNTLQDLADAFNERGFKSVNGKKFYPSNVRLLLKLIKDGIK